MLNSLRLTSNEAELVVVDGGLTESQRARLADHARIEQPTRWDADRPLLVKTSIADLHCEGVAVLLDSDLAVTAAFDDIVARAADGVLCMCPDNPDARERAFPEWTEIFALRAPLRRRLYLNGGFFAVGGALAPRLLHRWAEATARLAGTAPGTAADPTADSDQDALNALLMSEFDDDDVLVLPLDMALPPDLFRTRLRDRRTAACTLDGHPVRFLHYTGPLKPWQPKGWARSRRDPYTALLPRLLFGEDVVLRIEPFEVPFWLRPGRTGAAALSALSGVNRSVRVVASWLPERTATRLRMLRSGLGKR